MSGKRPMSPAVLRLNDMFMALVVLVAGSFLLYDIVLSGVAYIPQIGWGAYLAGPIFAHKVSELVIAGSWLFYAFMYNHARANLWPRGIDERRWGLILRVTAVAALLATVQATYAWTAINLGTSPATTDFVPVIVRSPEEADVWRIYLAVVVIAGVGYAIVGGRDGLRILYTADKA